MALVLRGDLGLDHRGVDQQRVGIDVGEDRRAAQIGDAVGRGGKRDGRHDHLVARTDAQGEHGRVQGGGPAADGHASRTAATAAKARSNSATFGPVVSQSAPQHLGHGGNVRLVDRLPAVGQQRPPDRGPTVNGQFIVHVVPEHPLQLVDGDPEIVPVAGILEAFVQGRALRPAVG